MTAGKRNGCVICPEIRTSSIPPCPKKCLQKAAANRGVSGVDVLTVTEKGQILVENIIKAAFPASSVHGGTL
jgi:hypothetical protein